MPKNPNDYALYKKYYLAREASDSGKTKRVERDRARTAAIKDGKLTGPADPRTVDHKTPLSKGGGNGKANIAVVSATANRRKYNHTDKA